VWSDLGVLAPELFDDDLRIDSNSEPLHGHVPIAQLAVEGLVRAVMPGLAGIDAGGIDAGLQQPAQYRSGDELRTYLAARAFATLTCRDHHARPHFTKSDSTTSLRIGL
jgi:hypothetical protein